MLYPSKDTKYFAARLFDSSEVSKAIQRIKQTCSQGELIALAEVVTVITKRVGVCHL
jgi:hypothetical protein